MFSLIEIELSKLKTDNVTKMNSMFCECKSLKELKISNFNTNNVTDMSHMLENVNLYYH